jgi:protein SCO1/2
MKKRVSYIIFSIVVLTACKSNQTNKLPIYGNREAVTKTVDGKTVTDTVYQTIPAFKFVNQYGDSISNKSLNGKIYVADFFFTSCPSICPVMQRNMLQVYNEFKNSADVKILSHTIDPQHDSVAVLKKYADKLGVTRTTPTELPKKITLSP